MTLLVSCKSGYIQTCVVREVNSDSCDLLFSYERKSINIKVKLLSWKTFPSKKTYGLTVHENQWNVAMHTVNKANSSSQGLSCFQIFSHLVGLLP